MRLFGWLLLTSAALGASLFAGTPPGGTADAAANRCHAGTTLRANGVARVFYVRETLESERELFLCEYRTGRPRFMGFYEKGRTESVELAGRFAAALKVDPSCASGTCRPDRIFVFDGRSRFAATSNGRYYDLRSDGVAAIGEVARSFYPEVPASIKLLGPHGRARVVASGDVDPSSVALGRRSVYWTMTSGVPMSAPAPAAR